MSTYITFLTALAEKLIPLAHSSEHALSLAWNLLEHVTGKTKTELIIQQTLTLTHEQQQNLEHALYRLLALHEPLQYVIGWVPFLDLRITVTPPVLIPRPETEWWCNLFIQQLKEENISSFTLLDMCTGSGCIALSIAHAFPKATIYAVDISEQALSCAQQNARNNDITNVTFVKSDLFGALPSSFTCDFILSNPPYIDHEDWLKIEPQVKEWEDYAALVAPDKGYAFLEKIIANAARLMQKSDKIPTIWLEMGSEQGGHVKKILKHYGFENAEIIKDTAENDRLARG